MVSFRVIVLLHMQRRPKVTLVHIGTYGVRVRKACSGTKLRTHWLYKTLDLASISLGGHEVSALWKVAQGIVADALELSQGKLLRKPRMAYRPHDVVLGDTYDGTIEG